MKRTRSDDGSDRPPSIADMCRIVSCSRASVSRDIQAGPFPKQVKAGTSSRWRISDLRAFLAALPQG